MQKGWGGGWRGRKEVRVRMQPIEGRVDDREMLRRGRKAA